MTRKEAARETANNRDDGAPRDEGRSVQTNTVFVSYSHKDKFWKDWLMAEPHTTLGCGTIELWSDDEIQPSANWYTEIKSALLHAKVAVLLVSRNFLTSSFIRNEELNEILRRRQRHESAVLWIPIEDLERVEGAETLKEIQGVWPLSSPLSRILNEQPAAGLQAARSHIYNEILRVLNEDWWRTQRVLRQKHGYKYEIVSQLGSGKVRSAFVARDHVMKRWVAITSLKENQDHEMFRKSLLKASLVDDLETFLTVYDATLDTSPPYFIRQFIEGSTLEQRLQRGSPHYGFARDLLLRLGAALATAHARGFYHLNIKPSNIVIDEEERVYLSPLSRRQGDRQLRDGWDHATRTEDHHYVIPELFGRTPSNLALSDQYLLGLVGYEMVTGNKPFRVREGGSRPLSIDDFLELPHIRQLEHCRSCPAVLAETIMRMTQVFPDDRFESLEQAIAPLDRLRDEYLGTAKDSFRRLAREPGLEQKVFRSFYRKFHKVCRTQRALRIFDRLDRQGWKRQHEMLKEAVLLLLSFAEFDAEDSDEPTVLTRVAKSHASLAILGEDYETFQRLLVDAFVAHDPECREDPAVSSDIRRAWNKVLAPGVRYMARF